MIYNSDNNATIEQIGGKAFNLSHLHHTDVLVPQWIVLSSDVFFDFLGTDVDQYSNLLENYSDEKLHSLTELISKKDFSSATKEKIIKKIKSVFLETDLVSVRSSATDEDGDKFSFAGMLESFLNVSPDEKIFEYIKKCYLSCFSERIMEYRKSNNLINPSISVAVIIQKMISPDYSGVIFTSNPITNNPDEILISVVKGLGEQLVSGESDSIDYIIDRTETITSNSEKTESGINEKLLLELYNISMTIEKSYTPRRSLDIEFCIKDEQIYILQSRLITTYSFVDKDKFRTILDNSNIIESYSGVTTPLTFTFAKDVYSKIYKQTLKSFYVQDEAIKSIENDLDNMLAFYENKIYYRLNSWYKMTALYPGYEKKQKIHGKNDGGKNRSP